MAKRFYDSNIWKSVWFSELPNDAKLTWFYLLCECDHAGIWDPNYKLASFVLGFDINTDILLKWFGSNICWRGEKIFITHFVEFQYGELNENNRAHKSVINRLSSLAPSKGLTSPILGCKDKDKDKDKDNLKGSVRENFKKHEPHPLVEIWNSNCGKLPKVRHTTPTRNKRAASVWLIANISADEWAALARRVSDSSFCNGHNDRKWRADFDWFTQETVFAKIAEGKYDDRNAQQENSKPQKAIITLEELEAELEAENRAKIAQMGISEALIEEYEGT